MSLYDKQARKRWNRPDYEFIRNIIISTFCLLVLIYGMAKGVVYAYNGCLDITQRYCTSKVINDEMRALYNEGVKIGEKLISDEQLETMRMIYDSKQIEIQQAKILKAHTKIAMKTLPFGTWCYLTDICKAVKVIGHDGYEIKTQEGIQFLLTDTDRYYTINQKFYDICKMAEKSK